MVAASNGDDSYDDFLVLQPSAAPLLTSVFAFLNQAVEQLAMSLITSRLSLFVTRHEDED
jgi:hypothetical protein